MAEPQLTAVLDELTKKSIDLLGRLIKKPPLTQKLLSKPPFRYLHDLFSELINTTGFAAGLYTDVEMNSENVKEKDAKIAYLTKMIDCVGLATGVDIRANPLKIVAGLEPEETNAFLQLIAKVILKKIDTSAAVARVLAGEHQGSGNNNKTVVPSTASQAPTGSSSQIPPQQGNTTATVPQKENLAPPAEPSQPQQSQRVEPRDRQTQQHTSVKNNAEAQSAKPPLHSQSSAGSISTPKPTGQRQGSNTELDQSEQPSQDGGENTQDIKGAAMPRRRERPISARPPPPKKKTAQPVVEETVVAMPDIIPDAQKDDDDDEFVVQAVEAPVRLSSAGTSRLLSDEKHGGLVQKILQTKKELIGSDTEKESATKKAGSIGSLSKDKNTALREIEELRESIQLLCQSANPLGKTLDYIQEDADSMNKELEFWKKESTKTKALLDEEVNTTKSVIEPLQIQLREIEDAIRDQMDKISNAKASIIQNDQVISKLLRNITNAHK